MAYETFAFEEEWQQHLVLAALEESEQGLVEGRRAVRQNRKEVSVPDEDRTYGFKILEAEVTGIAKLGDAEEDELVQRTVQGDRIARKELIEAYLPRILRKAIRESGNGVPAADLFQEGVIGFMRAIERFIPGRSGLDNYASRWVSVSVKAANSQGPIIRVPQEPYWALIRLAKQRENIEVETTPEALAEITGIVAETIEFVEAATSIDSLDSLRELVEIDTGAEVVDTRPGYTDPAEDELVGVREEILLALDTAQASSVSRLTPTERAVLELRFGLGKLGESLGAHTLEEIGKLMRPKITLERVRQYEKRAIRKLRWPPISNKLKPY